MVHHHIVSDDGSFTNHHAHSVIDYQAATDSGTRVDFDSGEGSGEVSEYARQGAKLPLPENVRDAVVPDGVKTRGCEE